MVQLTDSAVLICRQPGGRAPAIWSPSRSAYSSAIQYTVSVTSTETASSVVGRWVPAEARMAAVTIVP